MSYEVSPDQTGLYRWRFRATGGEVIALSAQGFVTRPSACRALEDFRAAARNPGETRGCPPDVAALRPAR
jgi:uncharacterized protein YegP (UPF0339 family)